MNHLGTEAISLLPPPLQIYAALLSADIQSGQKYHQSTCHVDWLGSANILPLDLGSSLDAAIGA